MCVCVCVCVKLKQENNDDRLIKLVIFISVTVVE